MKKISNIHFTINFVMSLYLLLLYLHGKVLGGVGRQLQGWLP